MIIVGICGASGSGKTYLTQKIIKHLAFSQHNILSQDYYYYDQSHIHPKKRVQTNYDHPDAIDFKLLIDHIHMLKSGNTIQHPLYDFSEHTRKAKSVATPPAPILMVEGILIFAVKELKNLFNLKIYVDTPEEICFIRRLERDVQQRGRTVESVIAQYHRTVYPMFLEYVQPFKNEADLIIKKNWTFDYALKRIMACLNELRPRET
ncbi:uridine kinase [candidate division KSB1 bacterium]|nr:uridine kinase [candidate division KSB1 bacterium]